MPPSPSEAALGPWVSYGEAVGSLQGLEARRDGRGVPEWDGEGGEGPVGQRRRRSCAGQRPQLPGRATSARLAPPHGSILIGKKSLRSCTPPPRLKKPNRCHLPAICWSLPQEPQPAQPRAGALGGQDEAAKRGRARHRQAARQCLATSGFHGKKRKWGRRGLLSPSIRRRRIVPTRQALPTDSAVTVSSYAYTKVTAPTAAGSSAS